MHPELLQVVFLGRVPYEEGLEAMHSLVKARIEQTIGDTLLLMEHPPVLTFGRNASRDHLLAPEPFLTARGVTVYETNRGGNITYHGPGQLVGYPIVDLRGPLPGKRGPHLGPVDFVRLLEEALILTCKDLNVPAQRIPGRTGVWTLAGGTIAERKIAAIGIHVSRAVTSHGFALNVTTDLRDFAWIVPCGIADREVTSLEREVDDPSMLLLPAVASAVSRNLARVLNRQVLALENLQALLPAALAADEAKPLSP